MLARPRAGHRVRAHRRTPHRHRSSRGVRGAPARRRVHAASGRRCRPGPQRRQDRRRCTPRALGVGARKPKRHARTQHRRVGHRSIGGRPGRARIRGSYMRRRALHLGVPATAQTRVFDIGVHLVELDVVVQGPQNRVGGPQLSTAGTREFDQGGRVSLPPPARVQCTGQYSADPLAQASLRRTHRSARPGTRWAA